MVMVEFSIRQVFLNMRVCTAPGPPQRCQGAQEVSEALKKCEK